MEIEKIIENMLNMGISLCIFSLFWFSNFTSSLWYNIGVLKRKFSIVKFLSGILKLIFIALSMGSFVLAITVTPVFIDKIGFPVSPELIDFFNIFGIIGIVLTGGLTYGKQAYNKLSNIFKGENHD